MAYGEVRAVDDVSFEVADGEFFGIIGPNGAGKTTTLEIIEGLRRPDSGEVLLLGERPWPRNPGLLPRIGVQLQASSFFERLTAREQIHTFASLYDVPRTVGDEWLERVGLVDKADTRVEDLSGGQHKRLSIACALVHDPEVVFLDEPTAALDPQARRNLWDLLSGLNDSGRTVVLTTHYMDEAEVLCDRVAILDQGRLLQLDSPQALVRGLRRSTRITVPGDATGLDGVPHVEHLEQTRDGVDDHLGAARRRARRARRPRAPARHLGDQPAPSRTSSSRSPGGSTAHDVLRQPEHRDPQGLPAGPGVGLLRAGLPADVPGALRRHLRRPGAVAARPGPGRPGAAARRDAGRVPGRVRRDLRRGARRRPRRGHRGGAQRGRGRRGGDAGQRARRPLHPHRPGRLRDRPGLAARLRRRHQRRPDGPAPDVHAAHRGRGGRLAQGHRLRHAGAARVGRGDERRLRRGRDPQRLAARRDCCGASSSRPSAPARWCPPGWRSRSVSPWCRWRSSSASGSPSST